MLMAWEAVYGLGQGVHENSVPSLDFVVNVNLLGKKMSLRK